MLLIRNGVFETNSSSTHCLSMCEKSEFEKWVNGELYYDEEFDSFVDDNARNKEVKKKIIYHLCEYEDEKYKYKNKIYSNPEDMYTEENLEEITQEQIDDYLDDGDLWEIPLSYEEWEANVENSNYIELHLEKETSNGDKVVAFGYYGYDG